MLLYALTIFLSAFLLFQVQPLLGKYILPWFGGSPAVWSTCMLLFQVLLLLGYGYAHLVTMRVRPRRQAMLHLALLGVALLSLPIVPNDSWKPTGTESPTWRILVLLTGTIGVPYFLLSSTGPLLQAWFSRTHAGRSPYRLYALSNLGSLLALMSYPFVVEPALSVGVQANLWSAAFAVFVLGCGGCAWFVFRYRAVLPQGVTAVSGLSGSGQLSFVKEQGPRPTRGNVLFWLALSASASVMLLATTNQLCQEVAVVPFLWVLPLAIYLLSFILTFDSDRWYRRMFFGILLAVSAVAACVALDIGPTIGLGMQLLVFLVTLFAGCMVCHGELVRSRPDPRYLTLFYLVVAAGGALGGILVTLVAPRLFSGYWEYQLGLASCCLLALVALFREVRTPEVRWPTLVNGGLLACGVVVLVVSLGKNTLGSHPEIIASSRNFYGLLRVKEQPGGPTEATRSLTHGRILHGLQFQDASQRAWPTTYFGPHSGIGVAMESFPRKFADGRERPLRIGVVGLGVGTIATYGKPGDTMVFYEINPEVERVARDYFTFLSDSPARCKVVLGDARVQMEHQLSTGHPQQFDILVIDAFSGDAIPMHLLTRESFTIYWRHLRPDGLLVLHVSNNNVDLKPVVRGLAGERGEQVIWIRSANEPAKATTLSEWLIVTKNETFLHTPAVVDATIRWPAEGSKPIIWTDDHNSLQEVLVH